MHGSEVRAGTIFGSKICKRNNLLEEDGKPFDPSRCIIFKTVTVGTLGTKAFLKIEISRLQESSLLSFSSGQNFNCLPKILGI